MKSSALYKSIINILNDKHVNFTEYELTNINKSLQRRLDKLKSDKEKEEGQDHVHN